MKYIMMLLLALCAQAQSFELDESAVNDGRKAMSTQKDISTMSLSNDENSVVIEHDRKKGKIENARCMQTATSSRNGVKIY